MSNFTRFMKQNKTQKANVWHAPTKSLTDENGESLKWEFRAVSTEKSEEIRDSCLTQVRGKGKKGQFDQKFNMKMYIGKLISACVVFPDLNDVELQNSYDVMSAEELLKAMVDQPGEYAELSSFVQRLCGFEAEEVDLVDEAKN